MTELVLSEAVFILGLGRLGRLSRNTIASMLSSIINSEGIELPNKDLWLRSLDLMATFNVDFPDAHMAALLVGESVAEVYSLDSDFDRIPGITRLEP